MVQRLDYIDQMKGLAILSVVIGHICLPHTVEGTMYPIATIIYSCHMSFFFFLSGYVNHIANAIEKKGVSNYIRKKIETILLPYLCAIIITPLFLKDSFPGNIQDLINLFNFFPIGLYWFLPVLFIFMILYLIRYKISRNYNGSRKVELIFNIISLTIFCFLGIILHEYHLIIYGIYWYAFLLGDFLSKNNSFKTTITSKKIFGISTLILCIAWKIYPLEANGVAWKSLVNLILSFICSTTACITIYNFFLKASLPQIIKKYLQEMGKFSLVIYVIPIHFLSNNFQFPEYLPPTIINLSILTIGVLHTLVSYTIGKIIFEIPYLRYIMFGKK